MTKIILISPALPYANGPLHLGHILSTYLPADIYARYCRLKQYDTLYVCATDEHGTPIEINAVTSTPGLKGRDVRLNGIGSVVRYDIKNDASRGKKLGVALEFKDKLEISVD